MEPRSCRQEILTTPSRGSENHAPHGGVVCKEMQSDYDNSMILRILIGIMVLGFALRMSKNIYRDMKRTESGNESRYLYGVKVDLWKEPLPKEKRAVFAFVDSTS